MGFKDLGDIEVDEAAVDRLTGILPQYSGQQDTDIREQEAVCRIEQANLYLSLLNHQLFSEGSARPEIISEVEAEIKGFILERLEVLLGMRRQAEVVTHESPFTADQIEALKAIADRLTKKETKPSVAVPQIRPLAAPAGSTAVVPVTAMAPTPVSPQATQQAEPPKKRGRPPTKKEIVIREPTPEEGNVGSDGTSYAQATGAGRIPMPSQQQIDQMNALAVSKNAPSAGGGELGAILAAAIAVSQKNNRDVQED